MSSNRLKPVSPTEALEIENGLSLIPRVKLLLTVHRADLSVNPIDEWQFKRSLTDFLKTSLSIPHIVPEEDLQVRKFKDLKKRKREDPVASGVLYIRDLGFLNRNSFNKKKTEKEEEEDLEILEKKFLQWRESFVKKLDGIELSLQGVRFKLSVVLPESDDFEGLKNSWEESYAFARRSFSSRGGRQQPDTLVLRGLPSRWFAEPRVSSKPSMLVTHTILSVFGKIRNLNVATDDDLGEDLDEDIVPGLQCKIVVQFEKHDDFCNALKVLCGRSMQKQGSRLRADYEASWDKNDFFRNALQRVGGDQSSERNPLLSMTTRRHESETPRFQRFDSDRAVSKRFKE